jgi:glycosyltransferase involved in cell wall biosynthesis
MKVLVLSINYAPEMTGFAPHITALNDFLAKRGHAVSVYTGFPFAPYWSRFPDFKGKLFSKERLNGVDVVRVTHFIPRRPRSLWQRIAMESSFCLSVLLTGVLWSARDFDVILYVGAQPSIAGLARIAAACNRIPYVVKITDLAAQVAEDVGIIGPGRLKNTLRRLEYWAYMRASGAIVICEGFKDALTKAGYPPRQVSVILESVDLDRIRPSADGDFRRANGIGADDFVVLYSGSMGIKQGLPNVVEAARLLKGKTSRVKWVLAGEGEQRGEVESLVKSHKLTDCVLLLPLQPEDGIASMYAAADVLLLNQLRTVKDALIPGKLLIYMASGKPVLAAVNEGSQGAILLRQAEGGVVSEPENPEALASAVEALSHQPNRLKEMGARNREFAERYFDRGKIFQAHEEFLLRVVAESRRAFVV